MTHSSWPTTYSSSQLNPSQWKELPLPATRLWHRYPTPAENQCQFQGAFAGVTINHVKTDQALPFLFQHPDLKLTQITLLSLRKSFEDLYLLSKMLGTWMFWVQYCPAHECSLFENSQFTCPTGSPLCLRVCPPLLNWDTTPIDVIKKLPQVKATSMGVDVARYFKIVSVSHAVDLCFFLKIPLNRQWVCR